ncbi:MAG: YdeI/OmpD-associated family protein [Bacteroidia bacterium]|nr:YdeI/OmpD-associated family protein [Bacteroidia bacterium]
MIEESAYHPIPDNLKKLLLADNILLQKWNVLTPIARNEWICWVTIPKKEETKKERLERLKEDILNNKKRPCCWPGCPHRNPNNAKWFKR